MFGTPSRGRTSPHGRTKAVNDSPILEFISIIEETPTDAWQKRASAFHNLVESIPHGAAFHESGDQWYNTPGILRHLALPISDLLKDARSTVVKRVCDSLLDLFNKCQVDARYLFKDLMVSILAVHAQTVQIIRHSVQSMVLESLPEVPCKMVMPLWMERLKSDKSRTVREACALYLGRSLQCWTEDGYLTSEIWMQVGSTLLKSLRDPSPHVRNYSKSALEYIQRNQPTHWDALINDPLGPVVKDLKLQRWLKTFDEGRAQAIDIGEELSIASKFSYNSDSRFAAKSNLRISSPRVKINQNESSEGANVPNSIAITGKIQRGSYPPLPSGRTSATPSVQALSNSSPTRSTNQDLLEQQEPAKHRNVSTTESVILNNKSPDNISEYRGRTELSVAFEGKDPGTPINVDLRNGSEKHFNIEPFTISKTADIPLIRNSEELKLHAARRRSNCSLLMQERFRRTTIHSKLEVVGEKDVPGFFGNVNKLPKPEPNKSQASESLANSPENKSTSPLAQPPEHMVIAIRLLHAHKSYVDQIMETLKLELEALHDFDRMLEEPGRPTEEEVLNYFESVGLCFDQRLLVRKEFQEEMDRISRAEGSNPLDASII